MEAGYEHNHKSMTVNNMYLTATCSGSSLCVSLVPEKPTTAPSRFSAMCQLLAVRRCGNWRVSRGKTQKFKKKSIVSML